MKKVTAAILAGIMVLGTACGGQTSGGTYILSKKTLYNSFNNIESCTEYDLNGNVLKYSSYSGVYAKEVTYQYDENNNCVEEILYGNYGEDSIKTYYEYDSNNNCTKRTLYYYHYKSLEDEKTYTYEYEYEYDENGRKTKETTYCDGSISYYYIKSYYDNGEIKTDTRYDNGGDISVASYDERGNIIKTTSYFQGELSSYSINEYDDHNNKTKDIYYNTDTKAESIISNVYEYDSDEKLVKYNSFMDGELSKYTIYEYDENGNKTKESLYYFDGSLNYYYEFDYIEI